jgi:hypothetical protein
VQLVRSIDLGGFDSLKIAHSDILLSFVPSYSRFRTEIGEQVNDKQRSLGASTYEQFNDLNVVFTVRNQ